jgi:Flp pilus assembly pilin Flp
MARRRGHERCRGCEICGRTCCPDCDEQGRTCQCWSIDPHHHVPEYLPRPRHKRRNENTQQGSAVVEYALMLTFLIVLVITAGVLTANLFESIATSGVVITVPSPSRTE